MSQSILERNLAALAKCNGTLIDRIRETPASPACTFIETPQEVPTLLLNGAPQASKYRPLDEAERLAGKIDVMENAVVLILGFGAGYHVRHIGEKMGHTGLILVFEPDLGLLRAVLETIDHSTWLAETNVILFHDSKDRARLNDRLLDAPALIAQGTTILEHPPSRARLAGLAESFTERFSQAVAASRTALMTTLVHSVTTCRNLALNVDHYAGGTGITPLKNWAKGYPAVLVAAGPSLARNLALLEDPKVREQVVIICVQTALKPLLARGIRPHFVTALDYHEMSRQFYDGLTEDDVRGVTLVCEPKCNRAIIDAFPGVVRCVENSFMQQLLGPFARPVGAVTSGATVAHLSFYLAQYLGCDPIAFIGQDLGFTEGLYYGPGASIHEIWAPELNEFNTIEMMEWQRITRMKQHLKTGTDQNGRAIFYDDQMSTYLQTFEKDFALAPQRVIDATEGGMVKQHAETMPLATFLDTFATQTLLPLPQSGTALDHERLAEVRTHLTSQKKRVLRLETLSRKTMTLIGRMLRDRKNPEKFNRHFDQLDRYRNEVDTMNDVLQMIDLVNQLGVFNRFKADRHLTMAKNMEAMESQRLQLERDEVNVRWLADAAAEFASILGEADDLLAGRGVDPRISRRLANATRRAMEGEELRPRRVAAMIFADPDENGLGVKRSLQEPLAGQSVLQHTLQQVGRCSEIESIILLVPEGREGEITFDQATIGKPVILRPVPVTPEMIRRRAIIAAARRPADSCWRGGIGGIALFDEILWPIPMTAAMEELGLDAALIIGPDWPLVDPSPGNGGDALIARYREQPDSLRFVFSQAPPGLGGCVMACELMNELQANTRLSTVGALLTYLPHMPQLDPIGKEMCVKLPQDVRGDLHRYTFDSNARRSWIRGFFDRVPSTATTFPARDVIHAAHPSTHENQMPTGAEAHAPLPHHLEIELTTERLVNGAVVPQSIDPIHRPVMDLDLARRLLSQIAERDDAFLTFGGLGDAMLHPQFGEIVRIAREVGVHTIHIRTDLVGDPESIDELFNLPVDIISVQFNADQRSTYETSMGREQYDRVVHNLERLINLKAERTGSVHHLGRPWIVPRLIRAQCTVDDVRNFYDRWAHYAGAAVIDPLPVGPAGAATWDDPLIRLTPPSNVMAKQMTRRMMIFSDGSVPTQTSDWHGENTIGNAATDDLATLWERLWSARFEAPMVESVISSPRRAEVG